MIKSTGNSWRRAGVLPVLMVLLLGQFSASAEAPASTISAPNLNQLIFRVGSTDFDTQLASIKSGEADMMPGVGSLYAALRSLNDSSVKTYASPGGSTSIVALFLNCRKAPLNDTEFRKAMSLLVNRDIVAEDVLHGIAQPLNTFIPEASGEWINQNSTLPNCNPVEAYYTLGYAGYTYDNQTRRWSDPDGSPLRELTLLTPLYSEAPGLWLSGEYIAVSMTAQGIKVAHVDVPEDELVAKVVEQRDYDMVLHDYEMGYQPFRLYSLLHSSLDKPLTHTLTGIDDSKLDSALEKLYYGITRSETMKGAHDAQARLSELVPYVPVYSMSHIAVIAPGWEGLIDLEGMGVANVYSFSNMHKAGVQYGGQLIVSAGENVTSLNPLTANSSSQSILQLIYSPLLEESLITHEETPLLAKAWNTQAWTTDTGKPGMKITFTLRNDTVWQDGLPFTSGDVKFCIDYLKSNDVAAYRSMLRNLVMAEAPDSTTVNIYLNATGYRHLYWFAGMTFLPEHIWKSVTDYRSYKPWNVPNPSAGDLTSLIGQGPFLIRRANLTEYVELGWNPMYFAKNPSKPSLISKAATQESAKLGDIVTLSYQVKDFEGNAQSAAKENYVLSVRRDGRVVAEQQATPANGRYEARVDTSKLGAGRYLLRFTAPPYGVDDSVLVVGQVPPPQGVPAYPVEAVLIGFMFVVVILALHSYDQGFKKAHDFSHGMNSRSRDLHSLLSVTSNSSHASESGRH